MLDRARCPGCGQPTWLSHDKATRGKWAAKAERCFSCDVAASRQEVMNKGETRNPGAIHYRTEYVG
jgi:hypothetical protein